MTHMPAPLRTVTSDRLRIAVHDWGGDGAAMLLVHATGFHGKVWAPVARRLIAAGYHAWSFDVRGHGDSDAPEIDYQWEGFATDVLAVVDGCGLRAGRLVGVGHSKGAAALVLAEARSPGTFARLWLYEPIIVPVEPPLGRSPGNPMAIGARKRRAVWDSLDDAVASYGARPPFSALHRDALRAYVEHGFRRRADGRYELKCRPEVEANVYEMMGEHRGFSALDAVACPALVVYGERTDAMGAGAAVPTADRLPDGRVEVLAGLGHFGPLEDPDAVTASILRFAAP
jgi:pimeloyl-ACP methyl ester carboxylesterase